MARSRLLARALRGSALLVFALWALVLYPAKGGADWAWLAMVMTGGGTHTALAWWSARAIERDVSHIYETSDALPVQAQHLSIPWGDLLAHQGMSVVLMLLTLFVTLFASTAVTAGLIILVGGALKLLNPPDEYFRGLYFLFGVPSSLIVLVLGGLLSVAARQLAVQVGGRADRIQQVREVVTRVRETQRAQDGALSLGALDATRGGLTEADATHHPREHQRAPHHEDVRR